MKLGLKWTSLVLWLATANGISLCAATDRDGIDVLVSNPSTFDRNNEPLTCGLPLTKGFVSDPDQLRLLSSRGTQIPLQIEVIERHADGSPRWILLDFLADLPAENTTTCRLISGQGYDEPPGRLTCELRDGIATFDTSAAKFRINTLRLRLFDSVQVQNQELIDNTRDDVGILLEDAGGNPLSVRTHTTSAEIECSGPLHAVLCVRGEMTFAENEAARYVYRMHFFAGKPEVRVQFTFHNPAAHHHPGNLWDLGSGGSLFLQDVSLSLALPNTNPWNSHVPEIPREAATPTIKLYQDSSGGQNWQSVNHLDKDYEVPIQFRGFRIHAGDQPVAEGDRAIGWLLASSGSGNVGVAVREFWQNFPKSLEIESNRLRVGLWPRESKGVHEILGGEQKTHEMLFVFGSPNESTDAIERRLTAFVTPIYPIVDPAVIVDSDVFGPTASLDRQHYGQLEQTCDAAVHPRGGRPDTIRSQWERIDEFGWRHFGDTFADNERAPEAMIRDFPEHHLGQNPISHFVNEYDVIATLMLQGIRRADPIWLWMADVMSRHHADICVYHTDDGAPAYAHGPFMHTTHETAAYRSTFRSYPIEAQRYGLRYGQGGGPNAGHTYVECLAHHYRLTGDRVSLGAFLEVADWAADSPWFDRKMMGDNRGYGNFLNTFVQAYLLTGDQKYYDRAMTLIDWIEQPFEGLGGNLFVKAAGRFLQMKNNAGQLDDDYRRVQRLICQFGDLYLSLPESRWTGSLEQRCFHSEVLCTCFLYAPTDHPDRQSYYVAGQRILDEGLQDFPGHYLPVKSWVMCFANTGAYLKAKQVWKEESPSGR